MKLRLTFILKGVADQCQSLDTPAMRALGTSGCRTPMVTTPFKLSALRSKVYRSMNRVATAVFRVIAILFCTMSAQAQTPGSAMVIVEPFVMISGGFDVEGALLFSESKVGIKYRQTAQSDPIAFQKADFDTKYKTVEISFNRFLSAPQEGLFAGATLNYFEYTIIEKTTLQQASNSFTSLGLRVGYIWFPFDKIKFFIDPTLGLNFTLNDKGQIVGGKKYNAHAVRLPPAGMMLRVGYVF